MPLAALAGELGAGELGLGGDQLAAEGFGEDSLGDFVGAGDGDREADVVERLEPASLRAEDRGIHVAEEEMQRPDSRRRDQRPQGVPEPTRAIRAPAGRALAAEVAQADHGLVADALVADVLLACALVAHPNPGKKAITGKAVTALSAMKC